MGEFLTGTFTTVGALFVVGTLSFWLISAALFFLLTWYTEDEKDIWAAIFIGAFLWIVASVNSFSVLVNPLLWLKWIGYYMLVGSIWSFVKWFSFLHKAKDRLRELKISFIEYYPDSVMDNVGEPVGRQLTTEGFGKFAEYLYEKKYVSEFIASGPFGGYKTTIQNREDVIPSVGAHYGSLVRWILWWPMSAFWTVLNDPIRRLAEYIVRSLRGVYTSMAQSVFKNEI